MEQKPKVRIYDSGFTPYVKSASLREENKDVSPTYFEWDRDCGNLDDNIFVTDGQIRTQNGYGKNTIAWLLEPRELHPENYDAVATKHYLYKNILTYDKKLLDACPNTLFYPLGGSSIAFEKWDIYPKSRDICMILSDKKTTEGHKLRHKIYEAYKDSGLIDFYGAGAGKPFESKFEVLKDYRYCIVVESCRIDSYFTEKLIDAISVGCIPFYWGADCINPLIIGRPHFMAWKFGDIESLKALMNLDLDDRYPIGTLQEFNLKKAKKYRICEDWIYTKYPELFNDRTL